MIDVAAAPLPSPLHSITGKTTSLFGGASKGVELSIHSPLISATSLKKVRSFLGFRQSSFEKLNTVSYLTVFVTTPKL
jgi:hypothetical protein